VGSQVSRTYAEPVDVGVSDGRPTRFVWRGRLYTVLGVLDHWVISREWWKQQNPDLDTPAEREFWRIEAAPGRSAEARPGRSAEARRGRSAEARRGRSAEARRGRSAEAAPGFSARAGTYELRHDLATGQWILARVWDLTG
jgi:Family of unknown function (DUF6504)